MAIDFNRPKPSDYSFKSYSREDMTKPGAYIIYQGDNDTWWLNEARTRPATAGDICEMFDNGIVWVDDNSNFLQPIVTLAPITDDHEYLGVNVLGTSQVASVTEPLLTEATNNVRSVKSKTYTNENIRSYVIEPGSHYYIFNKNGENITLTKSVFKHMIDTGVVWVSDPAEKTTAALLYCANSDPDNLSYRYADASGDIATVNFSEDWETPMVLGNTTVNASTTVTTDGTLDVDGKSIELYKYYVKLTRNGETWEYLAKSYRDPENDYDYEVTSGSTSHYDAYSIPLLDERGTPRGYYCGVGASSWIKNIWSSDMFKVGDKWSILILRKDVYDYGYNEMRTDDLTNYSQFTDYEDRHVYGVNIWLKNSRAYSDSACTKQLSLDEVNDLYKYGYVRAFYNDTPYIVYCIYDYRTDDTPRIDLRINICFGDRTSVMMMDMPVYD